MVKKFPKLLFIPDGRMPASLDIFHAVVVCPCPPRIGSIFRFAFFILIGLNLEFVSPAAMGAKTRTNVFSAVFFPVSGPLCQPHGTGIAGTNGYHMAEKASSQPCSEGLHALSVALRLMTATLVQGLVTDKLWCQGFSIQIKKCQGCHPQWFPPSSLCLPFICRTELAIRQQVKQQSIVLITFMVYIVSSSMSGIPGGSEAVECF